MHQAFARLRVLNFAAITSLLAAAVTATPTSTHTLPSQDELPAPSLRQAADRLAVERTVIEALMAGRGAVPPVRLRYHAYSSPDYLPPSGVVATFRVTEPHDPRLPALAFLAPSASAAVQTAYSTFVKPARRPSGPTLVLAGLHRIKPEADWPIEQDGAAAGPLLAYAPADDPITAPFDAVIGDLRGSDPSDDGDAYLPRPRPDPDEVLGWLEGRALGQFAPGQHPWVQNPLPPIVHEAKEQQCLAEAIYFEARSESEAGQAAVAQVVLNRVRNPAYPDTICEVVYQNKDMRGRCQFSFACDGIADRVRSKRAWKVAQRIARDVTDGTIWVEDVGDSTHYYAYYVRPGWAKRMIKVDRIGAHLFYRTKNGGWS